MVGGQYPHILISASGGNEYGAKLKLKRILLDAHKASFKFLLQKYQRRTQRKMDVQSEDKNLGLPSVQLSCFQPKSFIAVGSLL